MIKDILMKHNVYSLDLELELLRYFEQVRNEMLIEGDQEKPKEWDTPAHDSASPGLKLDGDFNRVNSG